MRRNGIATKALLAVTLSISGVLPGASAADHASSNPAALYDSGKIEQAERAYEALVKTGSEATESRVRELAANLLGLARAQSAEKKWAEAEKSFKRCLGLAEGAQMPRTFIDEARAGLVEAQVKLGRSSDEIGALVPPKAVTSGLPPHFTPPPGFFQPVINTQVHMPNDSGTQPADLREQEYLLKCAIDYSERVHGVSSIDAALANLELAMFYFHIQQYNLAAQPIDHAIKIMPSLAAFDQRRLASAMVECASEFANVDQLLLASRLASPLSKNVTAEWPNTDELVQKLDRLSDSFARKQDFSQAEVFQKQALSLLEHRSGPPDNAELARQRIKLAGLLNDENKTGAAIELYELALPALMAGTPPAESIKAATSLANLYIKSDNPQKTKTTCALVIKSLPSMRGQSERTWLQPTMELAAALARTGDIDLCRQVYTAGIASYDASSDINNSWGFHLSNSLRQLVSQLDELGQTKEVEHVYQTQLEAFKTPLGETDSAIGAYADLIEFYSRHQMNDKIDPPLDSMIALAKKFGTGSGHFHRLAEVERILEQNKQFNQCVKISQAQIDLQSANGVHTRELADAYARLASAYDLMGDAPHAKDAMLHAITISASASPQPIAAMAPRIELAASKQMEGGKVSSVHSLVNQLSQLANIHRNAWSGSDSYKANVLADIARNFQQAQMLEDAEGCFQQALDLNSKTYGPSSIQASSVMQQFSQLLRAEGKTRQADEMMEGSQAISEAFSRQQRGESGYSPFAPLNETIRKSRLRTTPPDAST